jgi:diguanylate cyclase (GGDEF)-like protein
MGNLLNNKVLKTIPVIFLIVIILRISYSYNDTKNKQYEFAKQEARVLYEYITTDRAYHRKLFADNTLSLDASTLKILPAFSSHTISQNFSVNNTLNIIIRTVSDNPRNIANSANKEELKAIKYFHDNDDKTEYFNDKNSEYYHYANVLKIDATCLKCHGKKEDAPKIIQDAYDSAYDYKLGDIRGIISIEVPTKNLEEYFLKNFIHSVIYDIILFVFLFLGISYLIKKSKKLNKMLEIKVKEKTVQLKNSLLFERLTHLPNRLKLIEDIDLNSDSNYLHLAIINIDGFNDINDLYGFKIGDDVLKQIAQMLKKAFDEDGSVYKLQSDEFALFTTLDISQKEFLKKVQNIMNTIQESKIEADDNIILITLSGGVASNEEPLMVKANIALQLAKKHTKSIVAYDNSHDKKEQLSLNNDTVLMLREAIKKDRITPYFQPIYNPKSKKIEKYEALARIILEDGRVIPPFDFLEVAVKSKLYPEITKTMIRKSFAYFKDYHYEFSLNISINDILNKTTRAFIINSLEEFNEPQRVIFEILESDRIENYAEVKNFIYEVKKYGCKIAIDDFGSGYSNFSHLFELNVDCLKIDSSLVKYVATDENSRIIVKTIINFASNLGLKTIAEFVEDKESVDVLEKMGVNFIQGYYIGKPEPQLSTNFN